MSNSKCHARYKCKRELLCRGKIYCGHCGRMMTGCGGNTNAYICSTDKLHSIQINCEVADWIMWEETNSTVNWDSFFSDTAKQNDGIQKELDSKKSLKEQYEEKIQTLQRQSEKLL